MKVKEFYNSMKNVVKDKVKISNHIKVLGEKSIMYKGYLDEKKPDEYLMKKEIVSIYCGDEELILEIIDTE